VAVLTGNLRLADAPGNLLVPSGVSGLSRNSVVNVSQIMTLDRAFLIEEAGTLPSRIMANVEAGLRLVLEL
jgi:mRNA interferase MazF